MQHEITLICDDIRQESGNKVSLMGIYDEAMLLDEIPGRLTQLCLFQIWRADRDIVQEAAKLLIELRGGALHGTLRVEALAPTSESPAEPPRKGRLMIHFAPIEILREGEIEFATYVDGKPAPLWVHRLRVGRKPQEKSSSQS